jgi:hypothetical protein
VDPDTSDLCAPCLHRSVQVCHRPAADRDTPDDSVRSSAWSIAATIAGAVHPVIPAKQTLIMGRLYAAIIAEGAARPGNQRTPDAAA